MLKPAINVRVGCRLFDGGNKHVDPYSHADMFVSAQQFGRAAHLFKLHVMHSRANIVSHARATEIYTWAYLKTGKRYPSLQHNLQCECTLDAAMFPGAHTALVINE